MRGCSASTGTRCWPLSSPGIGRPEHPVNQCGSGLARECGVSVEISLIDTPHSRASPLPQGG
ncbi:hypothetical protein FHG55_26405 [Pseudomonas jessenii]|uniref:Uncharacterized protein n=1 Tax=Pseudomonas jessenii TaxID=77298 RepID=A0A5C4KQL9_PSEJE|nr:hypothetical protein FHG55_26405 [Pseudomonas jessenii]